MRYFEKISFEQFKKDISEDKELYNSYNLPKRSTSESAGYDLKQYPGYPPKTGEETDEPCRGDRCIQADDEQDAERRAHHQCCGAEENI